MLDSMSKKKISDIRSLYNSLYIPQRHMPYIFMCPKRINDDVGFIMYIYGGAAFRFYYVDGIMQIDLPSDDYIKHFRNEKRGEIIFGGLRSRNSTEEVIELLKLWPESVWGEVCDAFYFWALKVRVPSGGRQNPEYERMRETHICSINCENDDIRFFGMEEKIMLPNGMGEPEVDMLSIRHNISGKPILSFIEYKCTTSALKDNDRDTGKQASLSKHFKDMVRYYRNKEIINKMITLYEWKQEFDGKDVRISTDDYELSEIVFLFSNIQWQKNPKKKGMPSINKSTTVTSDNIYKKLLTLRDEEDFEKDKSNVKVILLNDADTDNVKLNSGTLISYDQALERLKSMNL